MKPPCSMQTIDKQLVPFIFLLPQAFPMASQLSFTCQKRIGPRRALNASLARSHWSDLRRWKWTPHIPHACTVSLSSPLQLERDCHTLSSHSSQTLHLCSMVEERVPPPPAYCLGNSHQTNSPIPNKTVVPASFSLGLDAHSPSTAHPAFFLPDPSSPHQPTFLQNSCSSSTLIPCTPTLYSPLTLLRLLWAEILTRKKMYSPRT